MKSQNKQKLTNNEKKKLIKQKYVLENDSEYSLDNMSYRKKVYLLTIFRVMTDEGFDRIIPLSDKSDQHELSPGRDMDKNVLDCLYTEKILEVDFNSKTNAFIFENGECNGFYHNTVGWKLNVSSGSDRLQISSCYRLIYDDLVNYFPTSSQGRSDAYSLIFNLALNEIECYLLHKCKELNYEYWVGKRTSIYIYQLLNYFSVSKIYSIIDLVIDDAHLMKSRSALDNSGIGNYVAMRILEIGELAITRKHTLADSSRKEFLKRSELSKVFYELIHSGSDEGFSKCPKTDWEDRLSDCYSE